MAGTRIDTPSTDASMGAETDVEGFILSEDWSVREYTLGKAFFQFTLVANLVSSSDVDETWPEFDSKLALIKRKFPYKTILSTVQAEISRDLWRNGTDDYEELMATLGAILRVGGANLQNWVTEIIKGSGFSSHGQQFEGEGEISMLPPKIDHVPDSVPSGEDILSLKEYGDKVGEAPRYDEIKIQAQPPLFRSKLSFKGQNFEADGKSKKVARRNVAHKACGVFAIAMGDSSGAVVL